VGNFDHHRIDVGLQMPDEVMKCHCSWLYPHALISCWSMDQVVDFIKQIIFIVRVKNGYRFIEDFC